METHHGGGAKEREINFMGKLRRMAGPDRKAYVSGLLNSESWLCSETSGCTHNVAKEATFTHTSLTLGSVYRSKCTCPVCIPGSRMGTELAALGSHTRTGHRPPNYIPGISPHAFVKRGGWMNEERRSRREMLTYIPLFIHRDVYYTLCNAGICPSLPSLFLSGRRRQK